MPEEEERGGPLRRPQGGVAADATFLETLDASASVLDLHKSNLLRMEAQELVEECRLTSSKRLTLEVTSYCELLTRLIESASLDAVAVAVAAGTSTASKLRVMPFTTNTSTTCNGSSFRFGSVLTKASGNAQVPPTFEVRVQMPNQLWQPKDYKNQRYFEKRQLVVSLVAQTLSHKKHRSKVGTVYWKNDRHDVRKSSLVLVPPANNSISISNSNSNSNSNTNTKKTSKKKKTATTTNFRIQIKLEMESIDWIPPLRLLPNRSNVTHHAGGTPHYNHALLEDAHYSFLPLQPHQRQQQRRLLVKSNHDDHDQDHDHDEDQDQDQDDEEYLHWHNTMILLQIWCLQRGLLRAHDGFEMDSLALFVLYLYRTKQANAKMAPLQVLAVVFQCLAETRWFGAKRTVLVLPAQGKNEPQTVAQASFAKLYAQQAQENYKKSDHQPSQPRTLVELYQQEQNQYGPVFLDSTMRYNYWGRLSLSFILQVQHEARQSLQCLNNSQFVEKPFACLFMTPARFWDRFDLYLKIPLKTIARPSAHSETETAATTSTNTNKKALLQALGCWWWTQEHLDVEWAGSFFEMASRTILVVLQQALGDRVKSMRILSTGNGTSQQPATMPLQLQQQQWHLDSDQIPLYEISNTKNNDFKSMPITAANNTQSLSPTGDGSIILGIALNSDTCARIVDRGPPPEQVQAVQTFVDLWGHKAELRRFKDGAIVHAVVWNSTKHEIEGQCRYQNEDTLQGGIVERIVHYMLQRHFWTGSSQTPKHSQLQQPALPSPLRDMTSVISGLATNNDSTAAAAAAARENDAATSPWFTDPAHAHRNILKAFDALASFLKEHSLPTLPIPGSLEEKTSRLSLPLAIDAVEPLSPSLRYAELFPPIPHPFLGSTLVKGMKKTSGVIGCQPVCIQIRFGNSSKWPTDLKAMQAAKTAMLIQLANAIEEMHSAGSSHEGFDGPIVVTPSYMDLGFQGYVFRIKVRADPEIRLLRKLFKPSAEAVALLRALTQEHIVSAIHHSMVHAIHTKHPSAGGVVRMAMRWVHGHMLSSLIPQEAIELLVAKIYTETSSPSGTPGSVASGFLRLLHLLESHDWIREPMIVDPHGHIDGEDRNAIFTRFEQVRGPNHDGGAPLYIISPSDRQGIDDALSVADDKTSSNSTSKAAAAWNPSFTANTPEWVVLTRTISLARKTRAFLNAKLTLFEAAGWSAAFHETATSFKAYSSLLRVNTDLVVDAASCSTGTDLSTDMGMSVPETSYTKSMLERFLGPQKLRLKLYRNMRDDEAGQVLYNFTPVIALVETLRQRFGSLGLFFFNSLCPEVIAILWRPHVFAAGPFSAIASEFAQPCMVGGWKSDTMVVYNANDILREMSQHFEGVVTKVKVFQGAPSPAQKEVESSAKGKRKAVDQDDWSSDGDSIGSD